ncbi:MULTISPECIES: hydrogenase 2 large subunit [Edwardsiella]|uniref:hydrogenase (acceptor) n=2 Tax=Edwardsiella anguillarum TaxID=1821960 RepID=A0A076LEA3_9GAMM|nr:MULTISPECIES: hydrogenase 2 large subunit [Edwardsiella]AKM47364.1 hydrogenase 2 large subunit [Edwardsiella sp. EA181011]GAJ66033.1 uptake hydrogenase large subunit [Edwardsiella piscicida]AIJ06865.1 Uptake hydrogenase large subunit [Edwardsiella anguillarum ET080813]AKR78310.1 hydrogenase 2 large subunit [Edwardsiella sp. LADL05-105]KAB0593457.1 hydrogenase 2 large subunit [Edwardsiella anguillarum]
MSQRITIDPITRIEGHLRIDCEIENGKVTKAWSSGTMWRGMEDIVKGNDPRDAWMIVQRICGVCTTIHAIASVRAVESAVGAKVPVNAQYIRNLILAAHSIHDHIVHFYQLSAMDWVDITAALKADPNKCEAMLQGVSAWKLNSAGEFAKVQQKIRNLVDSGQLGIFANGYWGHKEMKLSPEVNLIAVAHYLQALECQRDANRVVAILGGKSPHIQNLAVGGVANPINLNAPSVLNLERLMYVKMFIERLGDFIEQVYKVDAAIIAANYPEWMTLGRGAQHYLSVPELPTDGDGGSFLLPGGYIENGDMANYRPINSQQDPWLIAGIAECSKHSWYQDDANLKPWEGKTEPNYTGWQEDGKYSWVKSPTLYGKVVEVGPLADLLVKLAAKHEDTVKHYNEVNGLYQKLTGKTLQVEQLHSTMGRIIGRAVRCCVLKDTLMMQWQALIDNIGKGDHVAYIPAEIDPNKEYRGVGFEEAPRGALSHWIVIKGGKIANYQAVVPSTWNSGPRNGQDEPGPYEQALVGTPVADINKPLEVVRTVHSFDPCMSCAVHVVNTLDGETTKVKIL